MKKVKLLCLLLCAVILASCFILPVQATADQSVLNGSHSIDAAKPLAKSEKMLETSKAVVLYERKSGTMIYNWNADAKVYPSSMAKIMTAVVALEMGELSDTITVTKRALTNISGAKLVSGEQLSLETLLYMMMVESANDASAVIAEYVSGSQDGFVKLMNEKAQALGCTGTHFTNAHGLHDEDNYTTARDLCRMLEYALKNETFRKLFTTAKYTVPATNKNPEPRELTSSNRMMLTGHKKYYDPRVTGGRTGYTKEAGRCLAVTAEGNGMELLAIVMGAQETLEPNGLAVEAFGSFEEMKILLDHAFTSYEYRQVFMAGQTVSQHTVAGGTNDVVTVPKTSLSTVLPVGTTLEELSWVYGSTSANLTAPVEKGQIITQLQLWYNGLCLAETDLVAANSVPVNTGSGNLDTNPPAGDGSWKLLFIVLGIIFAVGLVVTAIMFLPGLLRKQKKHPGQRRH